MIFEHQGSKSSDGKWTGNFTISMNKANLYTGLEKNKHAKNQEYLELL